MLLESRLSSVKEKVRQACDRSGRQSDSVTLIAVSKRKTVAEIQEAFGFQQKHFAENYLQEAEEKRVLLIDQPIIWHFIGRLQSKKIKNIVNRFEYLHAVDSVAHFKEIDRRAQEPQKVFLQVNLAQEESKGGVLESELDSVFAEAQALPNIRLEGLMAMPPLTEKPNESRPYFAQLRELAQAWQPRLDSQHSLKHLSMGTSSDYEVAIEEGATMVRVGTEIFGERFN